MELGLDFRSIFVNDLEDSVTGFCSIGPLSLRAQEKYHFCECRYRTRCHGWMGIGWVLEEAPKNLNFLYTLPGDLSQPHYPSP